MLKMDTTALALGFLAGLTTGFLYFLLLWYTVRRAARTGNRTLLLVSFLVRAALLLGVFYAFRGLGAQGLIAALLGFIVVRFVMTRTLGPGRAADSAEEAGP